MVACVALIGLGVVLAVKGRAVAAWHLRAKGEALRRGSVLNAERVERQVEAFDNPRSLALESWALRAVGVAMVISAVVALIA